MRTHLIVATIFAALTVATTVTPAGAIETIDCGAVHNAAATYDQIRFQTHALLRICAADRISARLACTAP